MLQELFRVPHVSGVFWTLTLELAFYAACSALYSIGQLKRTAQLVCLGQLALLMAAVGYPLLFQRRFPGGYAFLFLTMFMGTFFYRVASAEASRRLLTFVVGSLAVLSLGVAYVGFAVFPRESNPFTFHCAWAVWTGAYVLFGLALRRRRAPAPSGLCYLGRISYSIYLVHPLVLAATPSGLPSVLAVSILAAGTFALSSLTYHCIERPFIALGRRVGVRRTESNTRRVARRAA
jgi:peptidoglycan/LPS O-acetylase OafA/YrhL